MGRTETTPFAGSVFSPSQWVPGLINRLLESQALDTLSLPLGIDGTDHYSALLGRNACHFAPFSWYRWQGAYLSAKGLAEQAFAASDPNVRAVSPTRRGSRSATPTTSCRTRSRPGTW